MKRIFFLIACGIQMSSNIAGQNLNTTFRSKMTFTNQTLANVWGYTGRSGVEYALLGAAKGLIIVDISNPDAPQQIVQIPGPNSLWKEIKTYSHYAYVVSEGGMGIQVIDLEKLPSPNLDSHFYTGDSTVFNQLNKIHALHIDVSKGFLYAWGGNVFTGGAKVFDLKPDPYNPKFVGKYDQLGYIHDGFVDNDTMYSGHIYSGLFAIVNMSDKGAPELLGTQNTPGSFTHNVWPTGDHRTLFTTDEVSGSYLTSYDVSDPLDIRQLDKIQSNPGSNSIVHNTHVRQNWAITSWYKDGFTIVDITRPDNMVQVGNYDTYPGSDGAGFEGCWGVYPFFKSGTLVATNISAQNTGNGELFVITPDYHRACYLEGFVTDALTGYPLNNATIEVLGSSPLTAEHSNGTGQYKTGQPESGYFTVRISKNGYRDFETSVYFSEGEVVELNAALYPLDQFTISGTVLKKSDLQPVEGATVSLYESLSSNTTLTDAAGAFSFTDVSPGIYNIVAEMPGIGAGILLNQKILSDRSFIILMAEIVRRPTFGEGIQSLQTSGFLTAAANPFLERGVVFYEIPEAGMKLCLFNNIGQLLESIALPETSGRVDIAQSLPAGFYIVRLLHNGKTLQTMKLLKSE